MHDFPNNFYISISHINVCISILISGWKLHFVYTPNSPYMNQLHKFTWSPSLLLSGGQDWYFVYFYSCTGIHIEFCIVCFLKSAEENTACSFESFVIRILRNSVIWDSQFRWIKIDIIWCYDSANCFVSYKRIGDIPFIYSNQFAKVYRWMTFLLHEKCTHECVCVWMYEIWSDLLVFFFFLLWWRCVWFYYKNLIQS